MHRILLLGVTLIAMMIPRNTLGQPAITSEIAPTGKLRVGMNGGVPVLLTRTPDGNITGGVGLEVGKFIAEKLGVPFELVPYAGSDAFIQSFGKGEWDIGIGPQTPLVAEKANFVVDLYLNDYLFVTAPGSQFADAVQVDRPGVKIGVGLNSASDQYLSRTLKSAELVRMSGAGNSIEALRTGKVHVWAASASNVEQVVRQVPGTKLVPGAFTSDHSMLILPKGRSSAAQSKMVEIISEAKKAGIVTSAIEQTGTKGVRAAP
jgi:polar amino acid transport system substrate-binding protein